VAGVIRALGVAAGAGVAASVDDSGGVGTVTANAAASGAITAGSLTAALDAVVLTGDGVRDVAIVGGAVIACAPAALAIAEIEPAADRAGRLADMALSRVAAIAPERLAAG
jgi:hypothetical protein